MRCLQCGQRTWRQKWQQMPATASYTEPRALLPQRLAARYARHPSSPPFRPPPVTSSSSSRRPRPLELEISLPIASRKLKHHPSPDSPLFGLIGC